MKPEAGSLNVLSTTRARAKMREFRVAPEHFNALPRDPALLFSLAVGILGDVAATVADTIEDENFDHFEELPVPEGWGELDPEPRHALRFASVFFDGYIAADLNAGLTTELSLLCAISYYIAGSVGSAAVIARHMEVPELDLAGGLGRLLYQILRNDFSLIDDAHAHDQATAEIGEALDGYFNFTVDWAAVAEACQDLRDDCYQFGSPRELLYADLIGAVCTLKLRNASRTILPKASGLDAELWRPTLEKPHFPLELWPAQQRIADAGLLAGKSSIIQMPTSAGKTRATELIIRSAFLSKRATLAVIVAPYRSLCHDIRGDLVAAFSGEDVKLDEASDSYQYDVDLDELFAVPSVLIVTPEKLLYMLRRTPDLVARIGLVIYDEGHQFDGMTRGPTYELLLTSLRIALPPEAQVILISAVIGNAGDIAEWLIGDRDAVISGHGLLPTSKSIAFASWQDQRGRLEYVAPEDPNAREFFVPRVIADSVIPARRRERTERRFPEKTGGDVGLFLGLHVVANGSVAIFCGRKDSVTTICHTAVDLAERGFDQAWPVQSSDALEVARIRSLCDAELGSTATATRAAALGIFAHHADTPQGIRLSIEYAMKVGSAKFVVCTSTLAQGVNFPLRYLIVTSTRQGGEKILVRDFHNLMGRAGRAGMHTEGSVIFSTPSVYDRRQQIDGQWTWNNTIELLDAANSEPSSSSILSLLEPFTQQGRGLPPVVQNIPAEWLDLAFADAARIDEIIAAALAVQPLISENRFRPFIEGRARAVQSIAAFLTANMTFSEEEDAAIRIGELAANTLAYNLASEEQRVLLVEVFQRIGASIAANTDGDARAVIRRSPLPPAAVAELRTWLAENVDALAAAVEGGTFFDEVAPVGLRLASARSIRSLSDQNVVLPALRAWVAGRSYAAIFADLQKAKTKVGRNHVTVEHTVALCENGFGYDVAMVVASIADLTEGHAEALQNAAQLLQRQIKHGLTEGAMLAFHEAGFADRHVATWLGTLWGDVTDRNGVRAVCRQEDVMRTVLADLPSYFLEVASELGGWR